jgi:Glucodextranase, domain N
VVDGHNGGCETPGTEITANKLVVEVSANRFIARCYMPDNGSDRLHEPFGRPGMPPRWTSSSKEGVGTAYSSSSRVWFTISHGILNEIYFPTIDHPQTRDMQFLITDGESFFHEERRDLDSKIESIEADALGYRVENSDRNRRYRLKK